MHWRNSSSHYGLMAVICHWTTAVVVFGLFALGLWMTDLGYYDPWYRKGPDIHRSIGILLAILVTWRLVWRTMNPQPVPVLQHQPWERLLAKVTHISLYLLLFLMFVSGYLITTAEGQSLDVFNWFSLPAVATGEQFGVTNLEDLAGEIHEIAAYVLIGLALLHALAALKHHFWDKDATLWRMLGRSPRGGSQ